MVMKIGSWQNKKKATWFNLVDAIYHLISCNSKIMECIFYVKLYYNIIIVIY